MHYSMCTLALLLLAVGAASAQTTAQVVMLTLEAGRVKFYSAVSDPLSIGCTVLVNGSDIGHSVLGRRLTKANSRWQVEYYEDVSTERILARVADDALIFMFNNPADAKFDSGSNLISARLVFTPQTGESNALFAYIPLRKANPTANGFVDATKQSVTAQLVGLDQKLAGELQINVLFVTQVDLNSFPPVSGSHSRPNKIYEFGHRGSGNSFDLITKVNATNAFVPENTIASLKHAAKFSDFVEFDVQVSALDGIPFLNHDFSVAASTLVSGSNATKYVCDSSNTLVQHTAISFNQAARESQCIMHVRSMGTVAYAPYDSVPPDFSASEEEKRLYPSLQSVLDSVDPDIGFNIEFKYPLLNKVGLMSADGFMDRNVYVDTILKVLLRDAELREQSGKKPRRIVIGSFDPDMCVLINLKQSRFPVVFIGPDEAAADWRLQDVNVGTAYAAAINLFGILFDSGKMPGYDLEPLKELINYMKSFDLVVWTWGRPADDGVSRSIQIKAGVDGITMNRIYTIQTTPIQGDGAVALALSHTVALFCLMIAFGLNRH